MKEYGFRLCMAMGLIVVLSTGCMFRTPIASDSRGGSGILPSDQINDLVRSHSGDFSFETLHSVRLDIVVELYERDPSVGGVPLRQLPAGSTPVVVTINDGKGNTVYRGRVGDDGSLQALFYVPSAPDDMTLRLTAPGFESRTVRIRDLRQYSEIRRTMAMIRSDVGIQSGVLIDSDGDGVPDVYDAFPYDPDAAFAQSIPADGVLTIAFEDLFGRANAGDADYNDFIAQYSIEEITDSQGGITRIRVDATAKVKLAGYDHLFGIRMDRFHGSASIAGEYVDDQGVIRSMDSRTVDAPVEIVLFEDTHNAVGKGAWFELSFDFAQHRDNEAETSMLATPPYNPFLLVERTGHDIHLIDGEPLTEIVQSINPDDSFIDEDGFPWALLVPVDWKHPEETQRIEIPYPRFTLWRESMGTEHTDWYLHYYDPYEPEPEARLAADINPGGSSNPAHLTVYNGALYFSANDGTSGTELWRYDGVSATRITDLRSGGSSSNPRNLTVYGSSLYFGADYDGGSFRGLFRYNGGSAVQVNGIQAPSHLAIYDGRLYMQAYDEDVGQELWYYDGLQAGLAANIRDGADSSMPRYLTEYKGKLYFQADDGINGKELWWFDGAETELAANIFSGGDSEPSLLIVYRENLYFRAKQEPSGYELWEYNETGYNQVEEINTNGDALPISSMIVYNEVLYFAATDGSSGNELWSYDGTSVSQVADLNPGEADGIAVPAQMAVYEGALYFAGNDGSGSGVELYRYDGHDVERAADINSGGSSNPKNFAVYDGRLYFQADDGDSGAELWVYF